MARALPALGLYCPNAGMPFASIARSLEPRQPIPGPRHHARMSSWVCSHISYGGIDHRGVLAQERGERLHVVPLERIDVAVEQRALLVVGGSQGLGFLDLERPEGRARAHRRCSPTRPRCRGARPPRKPSSAGPLGGSTPHAAAAAGAAARPRTRGGSTRAPRAPRRGRRSGAPLDRRARAGSTDSRGAGPATGCPRISPARVPSGAPGAPCRPACPDRRSSRCCTATSAATIGLELLEALPRPGTLLHGVLRLEPGAQHAIGVRRELGPVLLQPQLELIRSRMRGPVARRQLCQSARSSSLEPYPPTLRPPPRPELIGVRHDRSGDSPQSAVGSSATLLRAGSSDRVSTGWEGHSRAPVVRRPIGEPNRREAGEAA